MWDSPGKDQDFVAPPPAARSDRAHRDASLGSTPVSSALLSTWTVAGLATLGIASMLDQFFGSVTVAVDPALPAGGVWTTLGYIARLGLPPVVAAAGIVMALWLMRSHRATAAAAMATSTLVVVAFSARPFAAVDLIGWREALLETVIAGRTVATTAIAIVLGFVLYRERFLRRRAVVAIVFGFPLLIGGSRMALGVHTPGQIVAQWTIGALIGAGIVWAYLLAGRPVERRASALE